MKLKLSEVVIPTSRLRALGDIGSLVDSMETIGLINPITVTMESVLVSGLHRLEAAKHLGWDSIAATVTDADARMVEIDENLCRNELTALERAEHLAERKRLYEALHPETKHGGDRRSIQRSSRQVGDSFSTDTSARTGQSERLVQRSVAIANKLSDDVRDDIRALPVADNQSELQRLSKHEPDTQRKIATKLAEGVRSVKAAETLIEEEEAPEPTETGTELVDLRCCSVEELLGDLAPESVGLIHADPPWSYSNQRLHGTVDGHYADSGMGSIVAALETAYEAAAPNSYALVWCTWPQIANWFKASKGMSWRYLSGGAWIKTGGRPGIGFHWRGKSEALLLYAKGKPTPYRSVTPNAHVSQLGEHSEKPEEWLRDLVETFRRPGLPVVDLYAGRAPLARACRDLGVPYVGAEMSRARHAKAVDAL